MSDESVGAVRGASEGGVAGDHLPHQTHPMLVAPSTSDEYNTVKAVLIPIACWRVDDIRFEFGSSFIKPDAKDEFQELDSLMKAHPGAPISIFGHADPVGYDDFNKQLSGRRVQAVYAVLTRKTDLWEDLYKNPVGTDKWDTDEIQMMLSALGYYKGPINGELDQETDEAVRSFQGHGLEVDGNPGANTRPKLYKAYMDLICVDKNGSPCQLDPVEDFLARGVDEKGKGDYQGCSEFNPRLLFSQEEENEYSKEENKPKRNAENAPNRRVIAFLFRPGSQVNPKSWPCPRAKEGIAGCKKRFWSDGNERRNTRHPTERREYEKTKDTFACRFYDRMASLSLCEAFLLLNFRIRLFDPFARPIPNAPYRLIFGKQTRKGKADTHGWILVSDAVSPDTAVVRWGYPSEEESQTEETPQLPYELEIRLKDEEDEEMAASRRLHNLGYYNYKGRTLEDNIRAFQRAYGREQTGNLEDIKEDLWKYHDTAEPEPLVEDDSEESEAP